MFYATPFENVIWNHICDEQCFAFIRLVIEQADILLGLHGFWLSLQSIKEVLTRGTQLAVAIRHDWLCNVKHVMLFICAMRKKFYITFGYLPFFVLSEWTKWCKYVKFSQMNIILLYCQFVLSVRRGEKKRGARKNIRDEDGWRDRKTKQNWNEPICPLSLLICQQKLNNLLIYLWLKLAERTPGIWSKLEIFQHISRQ